VGNLPFTTTSQNLADLFSDIGTVSSCNIVEDRETGRSRGFGFIEMSSKAESENAIAQLDGRQIDGRVLKVNEAKSRENRKVPSVFGGAKSGYGSSRW
jgi:RNA recognition motif-containing protein